MRPAWLIQEDHLFCLEKILKTSPVFYQRYFPLKAEIVLENNFTFKNAQYLIQHSNLTRRRITTNTFNRPVILVVKNFKLNTGKILPCRFWIQRASELSDCFIGYIKWGCIHLTVFYERRFFQQVMLFFHCACSYYCSLSVDGVSFRAFCTTIFWQMFNSHLADFIDCGSYSVPAAFLIKSMAATLAMLGCRRRSRRRVLRSIVFSLLLFSTFLRVH